MDKLLNNLVIFNGYPLSLVVALSLHVLLLVGLVYLQNSNDVEALELVQPTVIRALFIDENPQVRNQLVNEQRRVEREAEAQRAREAAAAQRRQEEAEAQRAAEARARAEEEARQAALRTREELERLEAERQRAEREREQRQQNEREAEQQRQRELAEAQRRREEEARRARQQAEAEAAAAAGARNEFELVQSATGLIQQIVQDHWSRPPSARNGMRAIIQIRMLPTGELLDATITQSSGDPAFDRSAENAVYRAAPFSELQQLPINVFNQNFRTLSLIFEPQDLLN